MTQTLTVNDLKSFDFNNAELANLDSNELTETEGGLIQLFAAGVTIGYALYKALS